jgi:hypothetical protein
MLNQHVSVFAQGFKKGVFIILSYMICMPFLVSAQNYRSAARPLLKLTAAKISRAPSVADSTITLTPAKNLPTTQADTPVLTARPALPAPKPALASGYINPYVMGINTASTGTKAFFQAVERINNPDSKKPGVGSFGIGMAAQSGGAVLLTLTKKTRWGGYVTLMGGATKNPVYNSQISGQYKANPVALAGIGSQTSPHIYIGGVAGASAVQIIEVGDRNAAGRYTIKATGFRPALLYGLQVSAELRHVWVQANLVNGQGLGVGLTYLF